MFESIIAPSQYLLISMVMTSFINEGKSLLKGTSKEFSGDHLLKNLCENTHQDLTYQNKLQEINLVLVSNFHPSIFDKRYINSWAHAVFDISGK